MLASRGQEADQGWPPRSLAPARTAVLLFGAAEVAWAVTVERMRGMDAGPGTDLGGLGWYLGVWGTMTAAMMLPSAAPTALVVARVSRGTPTVIFTAGYLAVWAAYGLGAHVWGCQNHCSQRGIISICRRNRMLMAHTDDAEN